METKTVVLIISYDTGRKIWSGHIDAEATEEVLQAIEKDIQVPGGVALTMPELAAQRWAGHLRNPPILAVETDLARQLEDSFLMSSLGIAPIPDKRWAPPAK